MSDAPCRLDPCFARYFRGARGLQWRFRTFGTRELDCTHRIVMVAHLTAHQDPAGPSVASVGGVAERSLLRCPHCGFAESLAMPADACVVAHACARCHADIRAAEGGCCVFCAHGSEPCPSAGAGDCCRGDG